MISTTPPVHLTAEQDKHEASSALTTAQPGCCFSIGYGAQMAPCCLETKLVMDVERCAVSSLVGGAKSFTSGACPESAAEAAGLLREAKEGLAEAPGPMQTWGQLPWVLVVVAAAIASAAAFFIWKRPQREVSLAGPLLQAVE
jgi:hypothetical protein